MHHFLRGVDTPALVCELSLPITLFNVAYRGHLDHDSVGLHVLAPYGYRVGTTLSKPIAHKCSAPPIFVVHGDVCTLTFKRRSKPNAIILRCIPYLFERDLYILDLGD